MCIRDRSCTACFLLEYPDVIERNVQQCLGNSVEGMERCQQYYDCGSYSGVRSSDIFYYCGGNGTSVIVYIATSYE